MNTVMDDQPTLLHTPERPIIGRRFRLDGVLATGGMAVLYLGLDGVTNQEVVIKVPKYPPEFSSRRQREEIDEKLLREACDLARYSHLPTVPRCITSGVDRFPEHGERAIPYVAMERLVGQSLRELLRWRRDQGERPFTPAEVLDVLGPVMLDLTMIHGDGYVHRDLKPENLFIVATPAGVAARILDFGNMKPKIPCNSPIGAGAMRVQPSQLLAMTPNYAGEEQLRSFNAFTESDVLALACIIVEMLTLRPPFFHSNAPSALRPTPRARNVDVGGWEPVLERALHSQYTRRYSDAGALHQALRDALPGAPVATASNAVASTLAWEGPPPVPPPLPADASLAPSPSVSREGPSVTTPVEYAQPGDATGVASPQTAPRRKWEIAVAGLMLVAFAVALVSTPSRQWIGAAPPSSAIPQRAAPRVPVTAISPPMLPERESPPSLTGVPRSSNPERDSQRAVERLMHAQRALQASAPLRSVASR